MNSWAAYVQGRDEIEVEGKSWQIGRVLGNVALEYKKIHSNRVRNIGEKMGYYDSSLMIKNKFYFVD